MYQLGSIRQLCRFVFFAAACIGAWKGVCMLARINTLLLPAPDEVLGVFLARRSELLQAAGWTGLEAFLGLVLGSVVAFGLALVFVVLPGVRKTIYPYAVALKSTPLVVLAPLLVLWFGHGLLAKILMAAIVAFFPVLVSSVQGLDSAPENLIDHVRTVTPSEWSILWHVRIPSSLPHLLGGVKIASSLSVVGAVIAEFTGASVGLGHLVNSSLYYLETPLMLASTIVLGFLGVFFFTSLDFLERKVIFWSRASAEAA